MKIVLVRINVYCMMVVSSDCSTTDFETENTLFTVRGIAGRTNSRHLSLWTSVESRFGFSLNHDAGYCVNWVSEL